MGLGLSFGKNKTSIASDVSVDKTETTNQARDSNTRGSVDVNALSNTTGNNSTTGRDITKGETSNTQNSREQQDLASSTRGQSGENLSALDRTIGGLFETLFNNDTPIHTGLGQLGQFDPTSFVEGTLRAAQQKEGSSLDEIIGGMVDLIGGGESENSNAFLLGQRAKQDSSDRMAGIASDAQATAQSVLRENLMTGTNVSNAIGNDRLTQLLGLRAQSATDTTGRSNTSGNQSNIGTATDYTDRNSTGTNSSSTASRETQQMMTLVQELMKGIIGTQGTESTRGTQSSKGGGLSLGL